MSGGSLDYVYDKVEDAAGNVRGRGTRSEHFAFADHLEKVAKALHDFEWMLSSDTSPGSEIPAIMEVITKQSLLIAATDRLQAAIRDANTVLGYLNGVAE